MSLSQKHVGKVLVPWFNHAEWKHVYNLIYSKTNSNWATAFEILKMWKHRTTLLSAGVEGTLIILEAMMLNTTELGYNETCHILSTCLVRFLNLCVAIGDKQGTFYKKARESELPKWIVGIRHDIAHGHQLPSQSILKLSLKFCLKWLKEKYWDIQEHLMTDFVPGEINDFLLEDVTQILSLDHTNIFKDYDSMNQSSKNLLELLINSMLSTECETDEKGNKSIPISVLSMWKSLLQKLHHSEVLLHFVQNLFDLTCDEKYTFTQREIASLWIKEVFIYMEEMDQDESVKTNSVRFKKFATQVVEKLNPFTINFVKEVLEFVNAPQQFIEDSVSLIMAFNIQNELKSTQVFTVNDLHIDMDIHDSNKVNKVDTISSTSRWIPIKDVAPFRNLPIGVLPHQDRNLNPLFAV